MADLPDIDGLFAERLILPDPDARDRLAQLVGIVDLKAHLIKSLSVLINPAGLSRWAKTHHPGASRVADMISRRPPLIILAGDVGSGKTELASTIGDAVARQERIEVLLFTLSLSARGQGRVGEMTKLLSDAFDYTYAQAKKFKPSSGDARGGVILLIDEADALAQSRESQQMHHEDRAGVNALIRGIDRLAHSSAPAAVVMCTNRLGSLDPAIRRRACDILEFGRPDDKARRLVLEGPLGQLGLDETAIAKIVASTGPRDAVAYGFTYSDLIQRLLPAFVLDAYPNRPVDRARAIEIANEMLPTPPFTEQK